MRQANSGCLKRLLLLTTHWSEEVTWCWLNCKGLKCNLHCRGRRKLDAGNVKCIIFGKRQVPSLAVFSCQDDLASQKLEDGRISVSLGSWVTMWSSAAHWPALRIFVTFHHWNSRVNLFCSTTWPLLTKADEFTETHVHGISAGLAEEACLKQMNFLDNQAMFDKAGWSRGLDRKGP